MSRETTLGRAQPLVQKLPALANMVLVILIGLMAARLFWQLWPIDQEAISVPARSTQIQSGKTPEINVDSIAAANLFGEQKLSPKESTTEVINAPETQLNLTLTGIIASAFDSESRALIKNDKNEQKPYAIGANIAPGVDLHAIYSNRVILNRGGRFETLTLEREKAKQAQTAAVAANGSRNTASSAGNSADLAETLGSLRQEILDDPSKAQQYLRINEERQNGKIVGYRIYPGQDRALFQKLGLRPGEVVTEINGQPLDNPAKSLGMLSELAEAGSVTVTLKRGARSRSMTVNFK